METRIPILLKKSDLCVVIDLINSKLDRLYDDDDDDDQDERESLAILEDQLLKVMREHVGNKDTPKPPDPKPPEVDPLITNPDFLEIL